MAGQTQTVITKREFSFTGLGGTTNESVVAVKEYEVGSFKEATVLLRVHSKTIAAGGQIDVIAYITAPSDEEPQSDFVKTSPAAATATITSGTSTTAELLVVAVSANFGSHLRIIVKGTQGSTGGSNLKATISVDLSLKE